MDLKRKQVSSPFRLNAKVRLLQKADPHQSTAENVSQVCETKSVDVCLEAVQNYSFFPRQVIFRDKFLCFESKVPTTIVVSSIRAAEKWLAILSDDSKFNEPNNITTIPDLNAMIRIACEWKLPSILVHRLISPFDKSFSFTSPGTEKLHLCPVEVNEVSIPGSVLFVIGASIPVGCMPRTVDSFNNMTQEHMRLLDIKYPRLANVLAHHCEHWVDSWTRAQPHIGIENCFKMLLSFGQTPETQCQWATAFRKRRIPWPLCSLFGLSNVLRDNTFIPEDWQIRKNRVLPPASVRVVSIDNMTAVPLSFSNVSYRLLPFGPIRLTINVDAVLNYTVIDVEAPRYLHHCFLRDVLSMDVVLSNGMGLHLQPLQTDRKRYIVEKNIARQPGCILRLRTLLDPASF